MGSDKAELELGDRRLLDRAIAVLDAVSDEVLLATGATPRYTGRGRPIVLDRAPDLGPLAGLEAALGAAQFERVVVLAVDMPGVDAELLRAACERAERDDCDALLARSSTGNEPLCAVYHTRIAPAVRAALDAGQRRMIAFFDHEFEDGRRPRLDTFDVAQAGSAASVMNLNTALEFEGADFELARRSAS